MAEIRVEICGKTVNILEKGRILIFLEKDQLTYFETKNVANGTINPC